MRMTGGSDGSGPTVFAKPPILLCNLGHVANTDSRGAKVLMESAVLLGHPQCLALCDRCVKIDATSKQ
eukprot:2590286-Lingulodinium_polyedra.AAC.1